MPSQYPKEQLLQIYKVLPEPLKEVLGSAETQDQIDTICRENQVTNDAIISNVYNLTMDVFMGLVKPDDFEKDLGQILQGQADVTQEIAHRIQRFILFPLKAEIAQLHKTEGQTTTQKPEESYVLQTEENVEQASPEPANGEQRKQDSYRESIE